MIKHSESMLQVKIIDYCRKYLKNWLVVSHKNEGKSSPQAGKRDNLMGRVAGMPDLQFISLKNNCSFFVELKYGKNKLTEKQKEVKSLLEKHYDYYVCYSFDEFLNMVKQKDGN